MNRPRLVLTGAKGRIGSRIASTFTDSYDLVPSDLHADKDEQLAGQPVQAVDVTDFDATCALIEGADYVVHTVIANEHALWEQGYQTYVNQMLQINGMTTQFVLEAAHRAGVKRVVVFSSMMALIGRHQCKPITKDSPLAPGGLYGCTKVLNENMGESYHREKGMSVISLRPGQPYYADSSLDKPQMRDEALKTDGYRRGLAVHIDDIALAVRCALATDQVEHCAVNLVSNSDTPWIELTGADLIGYEPMYNFTERGIERTTSPSPALAHG